MGGLHLAFKHKTAVIRGQSKGDLGKAKMKGVGMMTSWCYGGIKPNMTVGKKIQKVFTGPRVRLCPHLVKKQKQKMIYATRVPHLLSYPKHHDCPAHPCFHTLTMRVKACTHGCLWATNIISCSMQTLGLQASEKKEIV